MRTCAAIMNPKCCSESCCARNTPGTSFAYSGASRSPCTTKPSTIESTNSTMTEITKFLFISLLLCCCARRCTALGRTGCGHHTRGMNLYIVTGTTKGLGKALAEKIALDPASELIAIARAPDATIPGGILINADLADAAAIDKACDRIDERIRGKQYDKMVLINNAGIVAPVAPLARADATDLERNIFVNLVAPMLLMRRFLRATQGVAGVRRGIHHSPRPARPPPPRLGAPFAAPAGLGLGTRVVALGA